MWENHYDEMSGEVGMSCHEREGNKVYIRASVDALCRVARVKSHVIRVQNAF